MVTNRWLALPIFVLVMGLVYYIAVSTIGTIVTDFTNDVFVGEWIQDPCAAGWRASVPPDGWVGLVCDGIIAGVGAVIGFVPQMLVLFFMLAILEDVATWPVSPSSWTASSANSASRGKKLHPHADRHRLRRAGRDGLAHH